MKKSKGILAAGILGAAAIVVKKKLEAEPVRKHLIPRHWDEQEIKERMQSFTEELATGDEEGIGSFFWGRKENTSIL